MRRTRTGQAAYARGPALVAVLGVALMGVGTHLVTQEPTADVRPFTASAVQAAPAPAPQLPTPTAEAPGRERPASAPVAEATPVREPAPVVESSPVATAPAVPPVSVSFTARGAGADVVPVGVLPTGALQLPEDLSTAGWWAAGASPGEDQGTVVLAGHVDSRLGTGVLSILHEVREGDVVDVVDGNGTVHAYRVAARASMPKASLDPGLFTREGPHRLALITCGGPFDERTESYEDNVVVLADPVAAEQ